MSRGPGVWQRAILEAVAGNPRGGAVLTRRGDSPSEQSAIRRAAAVLEKAGRIRIEARRVDGWVRLVAFPPDAFVVRSRIITGLNGKRYRYPINKSELADCALMARLSEPEFEAVLAEGRAEGDLSHGNVMKKVRARLATT